ncbi:hypothetical protein Tco_1074650, partial [Tanacetum coccineum]
MSIGNNAQDQFWLGAAAGSQSRAADKLACINKIGIYAAELVVAVYKDSGRVKKDGMYDNEAIDCVLFRPIVENLLLVCLLSSIKEETVVCRMSATHSYNFTIIDIKVRHLISRLKIFGPVTIAALLLLVPVNVSGGTLFFLNKELVFSDIDKILISNVQPKSLKRAEQITVLARNVPHGSSHFVSDNVDGFFKKNHPGHYLCHQVVTKSRSKTLWLSDCRKKSSAIFVSGRSGSSCLISEGSSCFSGGSSSLVSKSRNMVSSSKSMVSSSRS